MDLEKYKASFDEIQKLQSEKNLEYYKYPAKYYLKPFKIAGNLYYIGDKKVCSHLIDTQEGLIIFDSGFPNMAHLMINAIWELGFNPNNVKYIIHSHEHFDHIGAACEFKELYGTKLVISKAGAEVMGNTPEHVYMQGAPYKEAPIFTPDITLADGEIFTLGNTSIRCVSTPGHSDGVMSFFFTIKDKEESYNVGYFGGAGYNTLYKQALINDNKPLTLRNLFLKSLQKVENEEVDIVLGNHPRQNETLKKREKMLENPQINPFIDKTEWKSFCTNLQQSFRLFIEQGN